MWVKIFQALYSLHIAATNSSILLIVFIGGLVICQCQLSRFLQETESKSGLLEKGCLEGAEWSCNSKCNKRENRKDLGKISSYWFYAAGGIYISTGTR